MRQYTSHRLYNHRRTIMLCDICLSREATVHFEWIELGERRTKGDACSVCFPPTLSEKERMDMAHRLFTEKRNQPAAPMKKRPQAQPTTPPNGGPATRLDHSGVSEELPSVIVSAHAPQNRKMKP